MFIKRYLSLSYQDGAPCLPSVAQDVVRDKIPLAPAVSTHGKALDLGPGVGLGQRRGWLFETCPLDASSLSLESDTSSPKKDGLSLWF